MKKCFACYRILSVMLIIILSFMIPSLPAAYGNTPEPSVAGNADNVRSFITSSDINPSVTAKPSARKNAFNDISSIDGNWAFINYLHSRNLIGGFPDGGFHPNASLTRAETAAMLVQAAGLSDQVYTSSFPDVPESHWAVKSINIAVKAGLIRGYDDGTFHPDQPVSRAEGISMVLNLSRRPDPGIALPVLNDVSDKHWAARSIAMGLAAKMVVLSGEQDQFFPDNSFTRSDFSRALSVMLVSNPDLAKTVMNGDLTKITGSVSLIKAGTNTPIIITAQSALNPGDAVSTGSDGTAQIVFPDGTGLLLKENTNLMIRESQGRSYLMQDGYPGISVERLRIELKTGKIFGVLASRYHTANPDTAAGNAEKGQPTSALHALNYSRAKDLPTFKYTKSRYTTSKRVFPRSNSVVNDEMKLEKLEDVLGADDQEQAWWETYTEESERLEVDMPWGTAGIRGTGFGCAVNSEGVSMLSILFGNGFLNSNGQTVNLTPGQYSQIIALLTSPTTPTAMTAEQRQEWLQLRDWLEERARDIQSKMDLQNQQELQTINTILDLIDNALNGLYRSSTITFAESGGGYDDSTTAYYVTYDGNGAGGGSVPASISSYVYGATVIVLGNTGDLYKDGFTFGGWNTAADGNGTSYSTGATINIESSITLYALWQPSFYYTVLYDRNGAEYGAVPVDSNSYLSGAPVTVLNNTGGLDKTGFVFDSWNTAADGMGTTYNPGDVFSIIGNTTLYAIWAG